MENKKAAISITYFLKNIFFLSQKGIMLNEPGLNCYFIRFIFLYQIIALLKIQNIKSCFFHYLFEKSSIFENKIVKTDKSKNKLY